MEWVEQTRLSWLEAGLAALKGAVRHSGSATARPAHLTTGMDGEDAAFFYLRRKGYVVVGRRWGSSTQRGDLDLIAWQGELLCFIEVKTRTAHDMAAAEAAVDWQKRSTLRKLARRYVRQLPMKTSPPVRFDVLSVYLVPGKKKEFVHFEGAFGWSEPSRWDDWA